MKIRDRIVELRRVSPKELRPNPKNWRTHPKSQRDVLKGLLAEVGIADAVLAYDPGDGGGLMIIDGHLRAEELASMEEVPVLILDVNEQEADKLLATLDPVGALAGKDDEKLIELLKGVETDSEAVLSMLNELAGREIIEPFEGLTDPDEAPAPVEEPYVKPGDLWVLGEHRILCGSSTEPSDVDRLMAGEKADVMWTDPPYGVDYVGGTKDKLTIQNDSASDLPDLLRGAFGLAPLRPGSPFYIAHPAGPQSLEFFLAVIDVGWVIRQGLVWVKNTFVLGRSDYHYRHEPIIYGVVPGAEGRFGRGGVGWYGDNAQDSVFEFDKPARNAEHPTMKPVELIEAMLRNSATKGSIVYEPFAGSGSTIIACERLRMACRAMEIDPRYVQVAIERWQAFTGRQAVLES